jgi:uncharacterized DUF497 family protein
MYMEIEWDAAKAAANLNRISLISARKATRNEASSYA